MEIEVGIRYCPVCGRRIGDETCKGTERAPHVEVPTLVSPFGHWAVRTPDPHGD